MTSLTENINQIVSLTEDEISAIEKAYNTIQISKGELFIEQGKICDQVAFVVSGKLRNFYFDEAGNEVTCYFVTPNNFVSAFSSFLTNVPTHENISSLEDTVLRTISKKEMETLSDLIPKLQIFRRVIVENLFIIMEKRIMMLQSQSAHERYEKMIKENPEILLSVPLQYTASFLGITPQHLSRLRKELT
ncbi:MAG: Crp/Fnr family transcriptional regulator, partial [Pseudomonadota bacterium]